MILEAVFLILSYFIVLFIVLPGVHTEKPEIGVFPFTNLTYVLMPLQIWWNNNTEQFKWFNNFFSLSIIFYVR